MVFVYGPRDMESAKRNTLTIITDISYWGWAGATYSGQLAKVRILLFKPPYIIPRPPFVIKIPL
jgi:hypothetical protein